MACAARSLEDIAVPYAAFKVVAHRHVRRAEGPGMHWWLGCGAGFDVTFASPYGGPAALDPDSMDNEVLARPPVQQFICDGGYPAMGPS
eukprot:359062-Chlamydomonas_euryale.AAC.10